MLDENIKNELWLVGDGDTKNQIEQYILDNNLHDSVKLFGMQDNPYKYMSKADLFVCSSIFEGFSTVVTEALICGLSIISTDVAGAKECNRCNLIVENDEQSLYYGIRKTLQDVKILQSYKDEQMNKKSFFSKERMISEIEKILD